MSLPRFERSLLTSGKSAKAPDDRRRAAKLAVMRAAGVATMTAAATASGAPLASTSVPVATAKLGLLKVVLGAVVALGAVAGVAMVIGRPVPVPSALTSAPATALVTESPPAAVPITALPPAPSLASSSAPAPASIPRRTNVSAASPVRSAPLATTTPEDPLAAEAALLEAAHACLACGDRSCARARLTEHDRRFPRGILADEAGLLEVDVALAGGDRAEGQRLARALLARSPNGAWSTRLKAIADSADAGAGDP